MIRKELDLILRKYRHILPSNLCHRLEQNVCLFRNKPHESRLSVCIVIYYIVESKVLKIYSKIFSICSLS